MESEAYLQWKADQLGEVFKRDNIHFLPSEVERYWLMCANDEDFSENEEEDSFLHRALEAVCKDRMFTLEALAAEENAVAELASDLVIAPQAPLEPVLVQEGQSTLNSIETQIVEAAKNTGLHNGYSVLKEKYDFSDDFSDIRPKDGQIPIPKDFGALIGMGNDMEQRGVWLVGCAVQSLLALGYDNAITQLSEELGLNPSTIYARARVYSRVPKEKRHLGYTLLSEICLPRYDDNEEKQAAIVSELIEEAERGDWSCLDARSHAKAKKLGTPEAGGGSAKKTYRYLVIKPNQEPLYSVTEPVWEVGNVIIDLKTQSHYKDEDGRLTWTKLGIVEQ